MKGANRILPTFNTELPFIFFKVFCIFCMLLAMALVIRPSGAKAQTYVFSGKFGSSVTGDGELNNPSGLSVDSNGNIYVADTHNHRIQRFGPPLPRCEGDLDGDGDVDGSDLAIFAKDFGRTDCCEPDVPLCEGDFDNDCDVDGSDLALFAADFGGIDCPLPVSSLSKTTSNLTWHAKQPDNSNVKKCSCREGLSTAPSIWPIPLINGAMAPPAHNI